MTKKSWIAGAMLFGALSAAGCGGSPLVGKWRAAASGGGLSVDQNLEFKGDGSVVVSQTGTGTCSGSLTLTGRYTVSGMNLTIDNSSPMCTGMVTCDFMGTPITIDCSAVTMGMMGMTMTTATYSVSSDNNTLTITTAGGDGGMSSSTMFTRVTN